MLTKQFYIKALKSLITQLGKLKLHAAHCLHRFLRNQALT